MALGGGLWFTQNKKLPGTYINFISAAYTPAAPFERGVVAMGMALDWGVDGEIMTVDAQDLQRNALKLFGYEYDDEKLKGLRDLFRHSVTAYIYKLNSNTSSGKAQNTFATAKYAGTRGNSLSVRIAVNADDEDLWDVETYLAGSLVDSQTVADSDGLEDNDFVVWKSAALTAQAGLALTGGTDASVTVANHQTFMDKIEAYSFNALSAVNDETGDGGIAVNDLYAAFTRRMRDELGIKFQCVLYNNAADYEGVVNVKNAVTDTGWSAASLVYWVTGVIGGVAVNSSAANMLYDGEFAVSADYTQLQLENAMDGGQFILHKVGQEIRVLSDCNSLTTVTAEKDELFRRNQTIRVIDNIANEISRIFSVKYLGKIPNDADGRASLWADIVAHHNELQRIRAIEDYWEDDTVVTAGENRTSVVVQDAVTIAFAMEKLYMTCVVQ